jgi:hypothetical protein
MKTNWRKIIGWVLLAWGVCGLGAETAVVLLVEELSIGLAVISYGLSAIYIFIGQYLLRKKPD